MLFTMASLQEDQKSCLKLAQIYNSFHDDFPTERVVENILKKEGDINCKIPLKSSVTEPKLIGCTALQIAVMKNETKTVDILLKNGADFTAQDQDYRTALHYAVYQESPKKELIDAILSKQLSMIVTSNPCDANGLSHFHIACLYNHADAVKFFLNNSDIIPVDMAVNSDAKRFAGYTPLHFAAEAAAVAVIRILLESNAKMNVKDARGLTPLHVLLEEKIKLLDFYNTCDERVPNDGTITAIEAAMDLLLDINDVDDIGLTQFHIACTQRDTSVAEYYLEQNLEDLSKAVRIDSPVYPGYTALHFAAHCNLDIARNLLKKKANLEAKDARGVTPTDLFWMKYKGGDLRRLLEQNWKYTTFSDNETRLLDFVKFGQEPQVMRQYLRNVKDIRTTMDVGPACWKGRTLLHFAVMLRDSTEMIRFCMRQGFDSLINEQDSSGSTPIHLAFRLNKLDVVEILVNACRYFGNFTDSESLSYLHIACALQKFDRVKQAGYSTGKSDVVYRGKTSYGWITPGSTALHVAVASGNCQIIETLLKEGFDFEAKDDDGQTPLQRFLRLSDYEARSACRILLSSEAVPTDKIEIFGLTRLHIAIFSDEKDIDQFINEKDMRAVIECHDSSSFLYDYDGCTPLQMAIMRNAKILTVKRLIKQDCDLLVENQKGNTPLYSILSRSPVYQGISLIVDTLLHNGALRQQLQEMSGITMLHIACYTANLNAVLWILTGPVDVNARVRSDCPVWAGCTPLHVLLKNINYQRGVNDDVYNQQAIYSILEIIIEAGADVNTMDSNNETPIHLSLQNFSIQHNFSVAKLLIENLQGFDVNPVDRNGLSYFHAACLVNSAKIVQFFLLNGADVNQPVNFFAKDFAGQTPLHLAVAYETGYESKRETVQMLLTNGADVKAEDNLGQNAFHKAVQLHCNVDIFEMFVKRSRSIINTRDIFERTPLELLLRSENVSLEKIEFFEKYGCRLNASNSLTEEGYTSILISLNYHPAYKNIHNDRSKAVEVIAQCYNALVAAIDLFTPDDMGRNLIHNIVTTNCPNDEIFKYGDLIKRFQLAGVDIDLQDKKGKTALYLAAQFGNLSAVGALLNSGADVNIPDAANMTPLNCAMVYYNNKNYCPTQGCHGSVIKSLVFHVAKLRLLNLEVNPNNIWAREEPWSFVSNKKRNLILTTVRVDASMNYQDEIEQVWSVLVNDHPRLFLGDFLSETGKGLTSYSIMPDLRNRIDEFFRNYNDDYLKDVCALQYRKAAKRVSLVELAVDAVLAVVGANVPIECIEMIFRYLTNSDLENFVKAITAVTRNIATVDISS